MSRQAIIIVAAVGFVVLVGCASEPGGAAPADSGPAADAGSGADGGPGTDGPVSQCGGATAVCAGHASRLVCSGGSWQPQACAPGEGCVRGECVAAQCSDECRLGDSDGTHTCELYDLPADRWLAASPGESMHDRARAYRTWLHRDGMAYGGVGNAVYADPPDYTRVIRLRGLHDSAIWTGTYLAAEALRLQATGSADARANIEQLVATLHLWFNVSGAPGVLARFVTPANPSFPAVLERASCGEPNVVCNVAYDGASYDYMGHISRDQYQGVMLGYALAYDALGPRDGATRELIRGDVVELVEQLMKERVVPTRLVFNGTTLGPFDINMRFVVLNPAEFVDGAVELTVDTSNPDDSDMVGFQEFIPNLAHVVRQFPGLGFVPDIPRTGSAIMLASFFQVALRVTEDVPAYAERRAAIRAYYTGNTNQGGNVDDWLEIARQWSDTSACGDGYYANNISMEPMYNLARLESDPGRLATIRNDVLRDRMWAAFASTKNSFFSFLYAANTPGADAGISADAAAQLAGFPPPPRVRRAVDLRDDPRYQPHDGNCADQTDHAGAVDVSDRVVSDFIWQRQPWGLVDGGDAAVTYPGIDYLVAYWLGRHHGFIADDSPGRCAVWR